MNEQGVEGVFNFIFSPLTLTIIHSLITVDYSLYNNKIKIK